MASAQISWSFAGPAGAPDRVSAIVTDPRSDTTIYVGTPGGGVWKTLDGGTNWSPLLETAPTLQVCAMAIDPSIPDIIYLGTGDADNPRPAQGVGRSQDGGRTWTFSARFTNQPVCTLAVDPRDSQKIYAGSADGLFLSTDSGLTWLRILSTPATSLSFDGKDLYAGTLGVDTPGQREQILVRSGDGGMTWTTVTLPPNPNAAAAKTNWVSVVARARVLSVLVSYETAPNQSFLDFYQTDNDGTSWTEAFRIGQSRPPIALLTEPLTGNLYATGTAFLGSTNKGANWYKIAANGSEFHEAAFSGGLAFLGGSLGLETAALSTGVATRTITQLPIGQFLGVAFDSTNSLWGAGPAGLVRLSPFLKGADVRVPAIREVGWVGVGTGGSPNVIASGGALAYTSVDRGGKFTTRTVFPDTELRTTYPPFVLDPVTPTTAYLAGTKLYRSTDSGTTWTALSTVDPDPTRVVVALSLPSTSRTLMYAATACLPEVARITCPNNSFFWRSADSGTTWTALGPISGIVKRIAVDPRQPATVYVATGGYSAGDLLQSTNAGAAWTSVSNNLPDGSINSVIIDANSPPAGLAQPFQRLYAATDSGVFVTFNAGGAWTDISGNPEFTPSLPDTPITDLALRSDGTLLAATFGRGIYWTPVTGFAPTVLASPLSLNVTLMHGTTLTTGLALTNVTPASTFGYRLNAVDGWITTAAVNGEVKPGTSVRTGITISAEKLDIGTHIGRVQLIAGAVVQTVFVTAHVTSSPATLSIVGGNTVSGGTGTALPPIQVLIADSRKVPLPGVQVRFAIISGGGSLNRVSALTNGAGIATTFLTLPATPGTVRVSATSGTLSTILTATALISPILFADSVIDGVTFNRYTSLGPGSVVSLAGQNLAEGNASAPVGALPTGLLTTRAMLITNSGEVALALFSVTASQVRAQLPASLAPGIYRLRVDASTRRSNLVQITVAAYAPGIFTLNGTGKGQGVFVKGDGSAVTAANPADRGTIVTFYAAGLGAITGNNTVRAPRVVFDIYQAELISSGPAPGLGGRYQVTVRVPAQLSPATNISVSLTIGGYTSNRVTIPVR